MVTLIGVCSDWHSNGRDQRPRTLCTQFDPKTKLNEFYEEGNGTLRIATSSPKKTTPFHETKKKNIRLICSMFSIYDNSIIQWHFKLVFFFFFLAIR